MKRSSAQIVTIGLLIAVFALSNIGLPIVMYLCPMMEQTLNSRCCTLPKQSESLAFVNQTGSCCQQYIVAERNTTPFLSVDKYQTPHTELLALVGVVASSTQDFAIISLPLSALSPPQPHADTPLFILHSAFLI